MMVPNSQETYCPVLKITEDAQKNSASQIVVLAGYQQLLSDLLRARGGFLLRAVFQRSAAETLTMKALSLYPIVTF